MSTGIAGTSTLVRPDRRRVCGLARSLAATGLLALGMTLAQGASAAISATLDDDDPLVAGNGVIGAHPLLPAVNLSNSAMQFDLGLTDFTTVNVLAFEDIATTSRESIGITFYNAAGGSFTGLQSLTLIFYGPAIDAANALGNASKPGVHLGTNGLATNASGSYSSPHPGMVQFTMTFTCGGPGVCPGSTPTIAYGSGIGTLGATLAAWDNLTKQQDLGATANGGPLFNLLVAPNDSLALSGLDLASLQVPHVPIPPAAWLLGSAMVALVGLGRARQRRQDV